MILADASMVTQATEIDTQIFLIRNMTLTLSTQTLTTMVQTVIGVIFLLFFILMNEINEYYLR
jgi:hypothetical protein